MTNNPPPQQPATTMELVAAYEALTEPEKLRLARRADQLHWGTEYAEGQELMNEAVRRALVAAAGAGQDGQKGRAWFKSVDFVAFLMMTMKGLTSDSRKSVGQKVARRMQALAGEEGDENPELHEFDLNHPAVDDALIDKQELDQRQRRADEDVSTIEGFFAQDDEVLAILEGEREGWSAQQIRQEFGMTKVSYDTARTRLRRGLDKLMPGRRKK